MSFDETPLLSETESSAPQRLVRAPAPTAPPAFEVERSSQSAASSSASLADLPRGSTAVVGAPDSLNPTVLRLLEMGLTPGTTLAVTRRAPGGDPVEVRVRGTRLCVRKSDLARFPASHISPALPKSRPGR